MLDELVVFSAEAELPGGLSSSIWSPSFSNVTLWDLNSEFHSVLHAELIFMKGTRSMPKSIFGQLLQNVLLRKAPFSPFAALVKDSLTILVV